MDIGETRRVVKVVPQVLPAEAPGPIPVEPSPMPVPQPV